jgi:RNA polymerase sigma factor (sigma-70 family)
MDITLQLNGQDESDFIRACINNERWAQKKLYEDNYSVMMAVAMRYSNNHDDALDILHESFFKVFKNLHKYQSNTSLSAWIRRILINTSIDYYRRDLKRNIHDLDEAIHVCSNIPDIISEMNSEDILKAMQQLPYSYRSVFNLFVIEGYAHKEIADMLNVNESTCRSNLAKARIKLKEILLEAGIKR